MNKTKSSTLNIQEFIASVQNAEKEHRKRGWKMSNYVNVDKLARSIKNDKDDRQRKEKRCAAISYPNMIIKDTNVSKSVRISLKPYQCK